MIIPTTQKSVCIKCIQCLDTKAHEMDILGFVSDAFCAAATLARKSWENCKAGSHNSMDLRLDWRP
jgi:hypothetical protein